MNCLEYCMNFLRQNIPVEVLDLSYREENPRIHNATSLDERIKSMVIRPKILMDMNLVGGIHMDIDTNYCQVEFLEGYSMGLWEYIITVPKHLTNFQSIVSIRSFISGGILGGSSTYGCANTPEILRAGMAIYNNTTTYNNNNAIAQTARLELLGDNRVLVSDGYNFYPNGVLKVVVSNNANLENIQPGQYLAVAQLVLLGVQADIFNRMRVKLDKGVIFGGHEIGVVKDIIDSYSDKAEAYMEYLDKKWRKNSLMNSSREAGNYIRSMMGNAF